MSNAVCLALLVSVTVHAASLANLASAATYYASPQGEGDGTSADKPFVVSRFWEEAQPGGTLVLLDGVYTGPDSMITPPREVQETPGAPIVIRAANDGQVTPMNKRIKQLAGIEYLELGHHFDSMPVPYFLDRQDLLHARLGERKSWQAPAKSFQVRYPVDGQFIVYVPELGGGPRPAPRLTVTLDGNVVLEQELLPYGPADRYDPRAYYQKYPIDVPAGAHTICVANTGGGTITTAFELTNYVRRNGPNLEVRGMQTDDYILLWLKHPEFNWMYRRMGMTSDSQPAGRLTLRDVPDETWSARWMDTVDARPVGQETVTSKDGILVLKTPPTAKSVVVRLQRRHIAGSQGSE